MGTSETFRTVSKVNSANFAMALLPHDGVVLGQYVGENDSGPGHPSVRYILGTAVALDLAYDGDH